MAFEYDGTGWWKGQFKRTTQFNRPAVKVTVYDEGGVKGTKRTLEVAVDPDGHANFLNIMDPPSINSSGGIGVALCREDLIELLKTVIELLPEPEEI